MEDDHRVRAALARALLRRGGKVVEADSVAAARGALDGHLFDVIITDLGLGDGSGFDVIAHARRLDPRLPVVVLSGSIEDLEVNDELLWHLHKPASSAELFDTVLAASRPRRARRTVPPRHIERQIARLDAVLAEIGVPEV